ncbi:MAG TPA: hypothetical protein VGX25_28025 [Actinophytocola sp.]|uniref:hypothetical protein n=1 Tax=Actinophytocola sp. TaxID=1872138 RepID=UPI002DDCDA34|nr:hypothetical protein [Actinophytocola sp.]HEV2783249.1 hypothetical protein [Actinophytocola sp.]
MSRAPHESTNRRTVAAAVGAVAAGLTAALALAGCSAGQDTQTDSVLPSVNGTQGRVGAIMIRDAMFAYPDGGAYPSGGRATLVLTIVNTGPQPDELVEVSSPVAQDAEISGDRNLTPRRAIAVGTPGEAADTEPTSSAPATTRTPSSTVAPTSTSAPSSAPGSPTSAPGSPPSSAPSSSAPTSASEEPTELGRATIVLTGLTSALMPGKTYAVTFVFRNAGSVTLDLPIAAPTTARPESSGESGHG